MNIKSISFDLDGTLYDFQLVMRRSLKIALAELIKKYPKCESQLSVDTMIHIREATAQELRGKIINLETVRLESFKKTLNYCGINDNEFAEHLNEIYFKNRFENVLLFDDVIPTLEALKDKYTLGIISNGNSYPEKLRIGHYFQFIMLAPQVGIDKPNPGIFHRALEKAGCLPEEFLHVGDSQEDDIFGSKRVGIKVAWFNRTDEKLQSDIPKPDYEIEKLNELLEILK